MRKPQPEFYHIAAKRLSIHPQEALFVDDESRFIAGAQAIGMHGVLFKDSQQAIAEIQRCLEANR